MNELGWVIALVSLCWIVALLGYVLERRRGNRKY
jgi:uncharacterized membrane protein YGL010W